MSSSPGAAEADPLSVREASRFSLQQRILLSLISWATYLAIALIGRTLRYSISWEEPPTPPHATYEKEVIYSFWHRAVFAGAWLWRNVGAAVMVSRSFDGEFIARTIEKLGFTAVRGSSSRGGAVALLGLKSQLENGAPVVFTIDGPRGPKYVAKPGPVLLSRASGKPMAAFYVALSDAWVLNTWDSLMIPKPFSKALVRVSAKVLVPASINNSQIDDSQIDDSQIDDSQIGDSQMADSQMGDSQKGDSQKGDSQMGDSQKGDSQMAEYHRQLQASLERVTRFAEEHVQQVGSAQFPIVKA